MEYQPFALARVYSDIMKTMWMTFFFMTFMPFGMIYSLIGECILYWVIKYNVLKRRTIKNYISFEVSTNMIDLLELTVLF